MLLAEKLGIPHETAVEAPPKGVMASPMLKYRGPFVLGMPEEALLDVVFMQRVMRLALEQGRAMGVPLPVTGLVHKPLTAARGLGLADRDFAAVSPTCWRSSPGCAGARERRLPRWTSTA